MATLLQEKGPILICIFSIFVISALGQSCPEGWAAFGSFCYFKTNKPWDFESARSICKSREGDMVSFNSNAEREFVKSMVIGHSEVYWLGLQKDSAGKWDKWVDGSSPGPNAANISDWVDNKPDPSRKDANCTELQSWDGRWGDNPCQWARRTFCKRKNDVLDLCDLAGGWHPFDNKCYKYFSDEKSWSDARRTCNSSRSDLATIETKDKQRILDEVINCKDDDAAVWIGGSDRVDDEKKLKWVTGASLTETNWDTDQPKNGTAGDNCIAALTLTRYKWHIHRCSTENSFMCERDQGECAPGWTKDQRSPGRCYRVYSDSKDTKTWSDARDHCKAHGGMIMKIRNAGEQGILKTLIRDIGNARCYIGMSDILQDNTQLWSDGSAITYQNFNYARRQNTTARLDCGYVVPAERNATKWGHEYCFVKRAFVCEIDVHQFPQPVNPPGDYVCDGEWQVVEDQCYLFLDEQADTDGGKVLCEQKGGDLPMVKTVAQQSLIAISARGAGSCSGLKCDSGSGNYRWRDGSLPSFKNWESQGPGGSGNPCMAMKGRGAPNQLGEWRREKCDLKVYVTCQKPARHIDTPTTTPVPTPGWDPKCGPGWYFNPMSNKCYLINSRQQFRWEEARSECRKIEGDLVSILGPDESSYITGLMHVLGTSSRHWIGLNDLDQNAGWKWSDGGPVVYFNWNSGEPNDASKTEWCVELSTTFTNNGRWNDHGCDAKYGYICKKDAKDTPTTTSEPPASTPPTPGDCQEEPMVSGKYYVQDQYMFAREHDPGREPSKGRINSPTSWTTSKPEVNLTYFSIYFAFPVLIKNITTKGAGDRPEWVKHYKLMYRYSSEPLQYYVDGNNQPIEFKANTNKNNPVTNDLDSPILASLIRIVPISWEKNVSMRVEMHGCPYEKCTPEPFLSGQLVTPDSKIKVSSAKSGRGVSEARLVGLNPTDTPKGWVANANDKNQWIQVELERSMRLIELQLKGSSQENFFVKKLKIAHSVDGSNWENYYDTYGNEKIFNANTNSSNLAHLTLYAPINAKFMRVIPTEWQGSISLRLEWRGCRSGRCDQQRVISGDNYRIPDASLTASSSKSANTGPHRSRLWLTANGDIAGAWVAEFNDNKQWIQADLGTELRIIGIAIRGRDAVEEWVSSYTVSYSTNGRDWIGYGNSQGKQVIGGTWNKDRLVKHYFNYTFAAQKVRLEPKTWNSTIALRWELYACPSSTYNLYKVGCFVDDSSGNNLDLPNEVITNPPGGMSYGFCTQHCFSKDYLYGGIKMGKTCSCGNTYGLYGPANHCSVPCTAYPSTQTDCGNSNANLVLRTGLGLNVARCPDGWTKYGEICYLALYGSANRKNWVDARDKCREEGGDLATINSAAEMDFVKSYYSGVGERLWIGLHCRQRNNYFEWSSLQPVYYTYWQRREPNNHGKDEDCVHLHDRTFRWNDHDCGSRYGFICQSEMKMLPPAPTPTPDPGCGEGWVSYRWKCYRLVTAPRDRGWAISTCRGTGGTLVRIEDSYEQAFVSAQLAMRNIRGFFWTDLSDRGNIGTFKWSNGQVPTYTNWGSGQPAITDKASCVTVSGRVEDIGRWFDKTCTSSQMTVCEKEKDGVTRPPIITTNAPTGPCLPGWLESEGYCYEVRTENTNFMRSWDDALVDCNDKGGDLASIHNASVNDFLFRMGLAGNNERFWIGLNSKDRDKGFVWTDGTATEYVNWNVGQPDEKNGTYTCVEMSHTNGKWNAMDCSSRRNWLCKIRRGVYPTVTSTAAPPTPGGPGSCAPDGDEWKFFKNKCYNFNMTLSGWRTAENYCKSQGGYLTSIHNAEQQSFIQGQTAGLLTTTLWLGLNELSGKGWEWSDGSGANYFNWGPNEPNDNDGTEGCVVLNNKHGGFGTWNTDHCERKSPFICAKDKGNGAITTPIPRPISGNCRPGFIEHGNSCFLFVENRVSWITAYRECSNITRPLSLASISDAQTQSFITKQLQTRKKSFWIGLRQYDGNNFWWVDNSPVSYTNWAIGEPNGQENEECVHIYGEPSIAGQWNDVACDGLNGYICMDLKKDSYPTPAPTPENDCSKKGYLLWNGNCYKVSGGEKKNWEEANRQCNQDEGFLSSVTSPYEQAQLHWLVNDVFWRNSINEDKVWLGLYDDGTPGKFRWADGWSVVYSNWGQGQPDRPTGGCVYMNVKTGKWFDSDCTEQYSPFCKILKEAPALTRPPMGGTCPEGAPGEVWNNFKGNCYLFLPKERETFSEAKHQCQLRGAELTSVHNDDEVSYLKWHIEFQSGNRQWIGLYRTPSNTFVWTDRTVLGYTNWNPNEPSDKNGTEGENCVEMYADSGKWNDIACAATNGYICKVPESNAPDSTIKSTDMPSALPSNNPSTSPVSGSQTPPATSQPGSLSSTQGVPVPPMPPGSGGALGPGQSAGVAFGVLFLLLLIGAVLLIVYQKRQGSVAERLGVLGATEEGTGGFENPGYSTYNQGSGTVQINHGLPGLDEPDATAPTQEKPAETKKQMPLADVVAGEADA